MFSVHRIVRRRPELFGSCRVGGGSLARTPGTAGDTHLASTYQAGSCGGVTPPGRGRHAGRHHQLPDMSRCVFMLYTLPSPSRLPRKSPYEKGLSQGQGDEENDRPLGLIAAMKWSDFPRRDLPRET